MKKIVSLLLVLLLALTSTLAVSAEGIKDVFGGERAPRGRVVDSGTWGASNNITWTLTTTDEETLQLELTGSGAIDDVDYSSKSQMWLKDNYENYINSVTIGNGITSIGESAFEYCSLLTSISLPSSLTYIGKYAFYYTGLTSVNIPSSVTEIDDSCFASCSNLTSVTGGSGLERIGFSAFYGTGITSFNVPASVNELEGAFNGCSSLTSITVDASNPDFSAQNGVLFNKDKTVLVTYPCGKSGTSYTVPASVTELGMNAFKDCGQLTSVNLTNVEVIGEGAFNNCDGLTSVTLSNKVSEIGYGAYMYCDNLTTIVISNNNAKLDDAVFYYCSSLSNVTLPANLTEIPSYTFYNCTSLASINIPGSVESIKDNAFFCTALQSVTLPSGLRTINTAAFENCTSLSSVTIPSNVVYIGEDTFVEVAATTLEFPASVEFIGETVLGDRESETSLTDVYFYNSQVKLEGEVLPDTVTVHGYVPSTIYDYCIATGTTSRFVTLTATNHTVSYNANGGNFSGSAPASQTKIAGQPLTLTNVQPTRTGYEFLGWGRSQDYIAGYSQLYRSGSQYNVDAPSNETLYAVWAREGTPAANGLTTVLYNQERPNKFMTTKLPYMAMNIDTDGKPTGIDTDVNRSITSDWYNELKKPWGEEYFYDAADNSFLTLDSDGYYSFDSARQTATYDDATHQFAVTSGGSTFFPIDDHYYDDQAYFGIQMSGEFTMPKDGKVQCGDSLDDMKYEFNGDDLVYIYIDGVKVINGGSSYGAAHTSVNFATGEVVTIPDGRYSGNGGGLTTTTLRALYSAAYEEKYPNNTTAQRDAYLAEIFENVGGNYVFKEGSSHSFDMFYAETGAGDSNCRVKLNMLFDPQSNETYTLTYNSGSKTFTDTTTSKSDGNAYMYGDNASAADNSGAYAMTLGNSVFLGWGLDSTDTTVDYEPGDTFPIYKDTILYAKFSTPTQSGLTNNIIFWDGTTMLQHEAITNASATYTLTKNPIQSPESGVTNIVNGLPTRAGRIFAGWYETQAAATARTAASAYPRSFVISTKQDASNNVNLYAGWVVVGTVTKASGDEKNYGTNTLGGFSMQGVQIRDTDITDPYQDSDRNKVEKGIRFVTVYSKSMLSELGSLRASGGDHTDGDFNVYQNGAVRYGYVLYGGNDIQNGESSHKLTLNTYGMVQTDCTKADHNRDHRNFNDYILSTTVVKFDDAGSDAYMNRYLEARAYVAYTDANGYQRGAYSTYSEGRFWGGCRTTFNAVKTWFTLQKV